MPEPTPNAASKPSPFVLWRQSCDVYRQGTEAQRDLYHDLMVKHGHIVKAKPGENRNLPCGWPGLPPAPDEAST